MLSARHSTDKQAIPTTVCLCDAPPMFVSMHAQDVSGAMQPRLRTAFNMLHLNSLRVGRSAINATFSTLQRRLLSIDPWLPMDTTVS